MRVSPEIISVVRQWVGKAENDLRNSEHTLKVKENCPYDTICFHAQQAAEKYLKALLTLHNVPFPKTHDLTTLFSMMPPKIGLKIPLADLAVVKRYYIEARDPGDFEMISREEAEQGGFNSKKCQGYYSRPSARGSAGK